MSLPNKNPGLVPGFLLVGFEMCRNISPGDPNFSGAINTTPNDAIGAPVVI